MSSSPSSCGLAEALIVLGSCAYLFTSLFTLSGVPYLLSGDQVFFWMHAMRMQHGELIYRDFFQFTPPGTDLVFLLAFKTLGASIWVTNAVVVVLGSALGWLCYRVAQFLLPARLAALAAAGFVVGIYSRTLNATHHWFSLGAVIAAVLILLPRRAPGRIAVSGALLGVATFFTQTRGPVAALGIVSYMGWECARAQMPWSEWLKRTLWLLAPMLAIWAVLSAYFVRSIGLGRFWFFQVTYVWRYMGSSGFGYLGLPGPLTWRNLPILVQAIVVYALLPAVYAFVFWRCHKKPNTGESDRALLLTFVGTALLAEVAWSPNWLRVYCVAMPAVILLVWALGNGRVGQRFPTFAWLLLMLVAVQQMIWTRATPGIRVSTAAGKTMTNLVTAEKLTWLTQHMNAQNGFFQAAWPGMYLPFHAVNPLYIDCLSTTRQTRPEYVDLAIQEMTASQVRYILWSKRLDGTSLEEPGAYQLADFKALLHNRYRMVQEFTDGDSLWELNQR